MSYKFTTVMVIFLSILLCFFIRLAYALLTCFFSFIKS